MSDKELTMEEALENIEEMAITNDFTPEILIGLVNVGLCQVNHANSIEEFSRMLACKKVESSDDK